MDRALQALSLLFVKINNQIAGMAMVIGLGSLAYLYPALGSALFYYLIVVAMLGVLLTSGWLIVRGVDEQRWRELAQVG